jgi:hypothetical protein
MTARLWVAIAGPSRGKRPMMVPATVRNLESGATTEVVVPLGGDAAGVPLDPGRYLVEAYLPSGEHLRKAARLEGPEDARVTLAAAPARKDWLALQQLNAPAQRLVRGARRLPLVKKAGSPPPPVEGALRLRAGGANGTLPRLLAALVTDPRRVLFLARDAPLAWGERDETLASARILPEGDGSLVMVAQDGVVDAVAVPGEWLTLSGEPAAIEVLWNESTGALSAAVEDPDLGMVLGYLAGGQTGLAARALAGVATELVAEKIRNPYGAAAGGYVLLRQALAGDELEPGWRRWIGNLARGFDHLPDGHVIRATLLRNDLGADGDPDPTPEDAARGFLRALDAGLPLFATGVRALLDGLMSFGPGEVPALRGELDAALRVVRRAASFLDTRQAFTTLEIPLEAP